MRLRELVHFGIDGPGRPWGRNDDKCGIECLVLNALRYSPFDDEAVHAKLNCNASIRVQSLQKKKKVVQVSHLMGTSA